MVDYLWIPMDWKGSFIKVVRVKVLGEVELMFGCGATCHWVLFALEEENVFLIGQKERFL